jgi:signal transduction histidine kinase
MRFWFSQEPAKPDTAQQSFPGQWLFYLIAISGILISFVLWFISLVESKSNFNQIIHMQAEHVASDIQLQLELRISALKHMAKHLQETSVDFENNWQDIVSYMRDYGGFTAVAWVDKRYKLQRIVPQSDSVINQLYLDFIKRHTKNIITLGQQNQAWISPAIFSKSNQSLAFMVVPLPLHNMKIGGFLIAMIDFKNAFKVHLNPTHYAMAIYYDTHKIFQEGVITRSPTTISTADLTFDGIHLKIFVQPLAHIIAAMQTALPYITLILGIGIAILFAFVTSLAQIANQRAKSLVIINQDLKKEITERMHAEAAKQALEKAFLQGQKLQAIGTLASGIAHDFNNLLYAIIGYAEMARDDLDKESIIYQNLGHVLEASERGRELISRILAFSRRQPLELQPVSIQSTLGSALALLKPTIPASVVIEVIDKLPGVFYVVGDKARIHQVIVNLVNNAVDAMASEGSISIKLSLVLADDELLQQFPDLRSNINYCKIEIADTGDGMDSSTLERIFEPFFTTKEVGKGTGLGLATVHTTVKEHQGIIIVTSELGRGTLFTILLPEYKPA